MDRGVMERTLRARMAKKFLPCRIEQRLLLSPDLRDWLPEGHLALCLVDGVISSI
jgi:hypothetical protein